MPGLNGALIAIPNRGRPSSGPKYSGITSEQSSPNYPSTAHLLLPLRLKRPYPSLLSSRLLHDLRRHCHHVRNPGTHILGRFGAQLKEGSLPEIKGTLEEAHSITDVCPIRCLGSLPRSPRQSLQRLYLCRRASVCPRFPSPPTHTTPGASPHYTSFLQP